VSEERIEMELDLDAIVPENKGLPGDWLRGMGEQERRNFAELLKGSPRQFEKLAELIKTRYRESVLRTHDMANPNWMFVLAREEGYRKALVDLYKLIPQTKE
jgi:hypothetical protein